MRRAISRRIRSGLVVLFGGLGSLPLPAAGASHGAPDSSGSSSSATAAAPPVPGFDEPEHRFGLALGYAAAVRSGVAAPMGRGEYTFGWKGWAIGVCFALDFARRDALSDASDDLTLGGLVLRRNELLGDVRLGAGAELGIVSLARGSSGQAEAVLYHGTSSALELGADLGRSATMRPFVSMRADFPWFETELERLTPAPADGTTVVESWQRWTPVFSVWGGLAL